VNIDTGGAPENNTINSTVSHYATNQSLVRNTGANCTYCHVQPNDVIRASWSTNVSLNNWPTSNKSFIGLIRHETNDSHCDNCHGNLSSSITFHSIQLAKDISVHYAFDWEGDDPIDEGDGLNDPFPNKRESCFACHENSMSFGGPKKYRLCEECHLPNGTGPFTLSNHTNSEERFTLRSDLSGWSVSQRDALGIPIIYNHVPFNEIWNISVVSVSRNLSGETSESGMNTQSSCFSWNPATPNGTCHGVGYSLRLQATPPEDLALGKEYFMHYGELEYGAGGVGSNYFNVTFMNTYIPDYAPNTSDCLFCHNQSNSSVRRFWGNAILIYYNRSNQSQFIGPELMFNATELSECYECHTLSGSAPETFHIEGLVFGGGPDCVSCHDIGLTTAADVDVSKMNTSASPPAIHRNLNTLLGTPGFADPTFNGSNDSKRCWACHSNGSRPRGMGLNFLRPWLCWDCHSNTTGGINTTTLRGNYSAPGIFSHIPANAMGNYSAFFQTNITTTVQCWICHNNSVSNTNDTEPGPELGHSAKSNVSHYGIKTFLVNNTAQNCTYCHVQSNASIRALWGTNIPLRFWPTTNVSYRGLIRHETNVSHCNNCHGNLSSSITFHSIQLAKDISVHYAFDWEGDDPIDEGDGLNDPFPNKRESCYACHEDGMDFGSTGNYKICENCHLPNGTGPYIDDTIGAEYDLRSDLSGWSVSQRDALGIPVIYSHVPFNQIQNSTSGLDVSRNLSGETNESGMNTQSSCFSWNPATNNGTCHGVSYAARFNATPPEDLALGKEYFMHFGEREYGDGGVGSNYFNVTYMNTFIPDYAPNTSDCLFCHNQSNGSVRRFWGNAILIYYNRSNQSQFIGPELMFGAVNNSECWFCHTTAQTQPRNFHIEGMNPLPRCEFCHFNLTIMISFNASEKWINDSLFTPSVHGNFSVIYCTNCHTLTEGHPPPESRWHWCEDCHVVMPKDSNGVPIKDAQQRHNMTFRPQFNFYNVSGTMTPALNITDCTFCHDSTLYNEARTTFTNASGKDCRFCHSFPDLNPDSPY
jgi:hypothetical protein